MIKSTAPVLALVLGMLSGSAAAQMAYVGSSTIGETIIPEAAEAFTAKTRISFGSIEIQGAGKSLEMVLRGEAQLAGVSRSLSSQEKQRRFYNRIIGYDAVGIFVHPTHPVTTLTKEQLKAILYRADYQLEGAWRGRRTDRLNHGHLGRRAGTDKRTARQHHGWSSLS